MLSFNASKTEAEILQRIKNTRKESHSFLEELNNTNTIKNAPAVFTLKTLKYALEFSEEQAFAEEAKSADESSLICLKQTETPELIGNDSFMEAETIISEIRHKNDTDLMKIDKRLDQEKQKNLFDKQREFEEHKRATYKSSVEKLEKCNAARHLREEKNRKRNEQLRKESEENFKKLEEEQKREQQVINQKFKNRQEEAARRQRLKVQQGKERMVKAREWRLECTEMSNKLLASMQEPRLSCFQSDPSVVEHWQAASLLMRKIAEATRDGLEVIDVELLHDLQQCQIDFHERVYKCKKQLDKLREEKDVAEAEESKRQVELQKKQAREMEEKKQKENILKNPENQLPPVPPELETSLGRGAYKHMTALRLLFKEYKEKSDQICNNKTPENKLIMTGTRSVISRSFSSITDRSGSDIKNCLDDLQGLLKKEKMKFGSKEFSIGSVPLGLDFARFELALRFVKQCEEQVSSSHKAAFPLAFAILGVWTTDATFGELMVAHLQAKCPYIIPWYPPSLPNQSVEDYSKSLGYKVSKGKVEDQAKYLRRMSGIVRTYAAIIQSPKPLGCLNHPHGIQHGWTWLTRFMNVEPRKEVTATILYDFIDVAGHALFLEYGKQFIKIMKIIRHRFLDEITRVSEGQHRGPTERLKIFMEDCEKLNSVRKPEGHLKKEFWNTYHDGTITGG